MINDPELNQYKEFPFLQPQLKVTSRSSLSISILLYNSCLHMESLRFHTLHSHDISCCKLLGILYQHLRVILRMTTSVIARFLVRHPDIHFLSHQCIVWMKGFKPITQLFHSTLHHIDRKLLITSCHCVRSWIISRIMHNIQIQFTQ